MSTIERLNNERDERFLFIKLNKIVGILINVVQVDRLPEVEEGRTADS